MGKGFIRFALPKGCQYAKLLLLCTHTSKTTLNSCNLQHETPQKWDLQSNNSTLWSLVLFARLNMDSLSRKMSSKYAKSLQCWYWGVNVCMLQNIFCNLYINGNEKTPWIMLLNVRSTWGQNISVHDRHALKRSICKREEGFSKCLLCHDVVRVFVPSLVLVFVRAILSWT